MKKRYVFLTAVLCLSMLVTGCVHRVGSNQPVTPYESVMTYNDGLAQANNSIAKGIIALPPGVLAPTKAGAILTAQGRIARIDRELTSILKQGPTVATSQADRISNLIQQLSEASTELVNAGTVGITNPTSKVTFDVEIAVISTLTQQILGGLKAAGVIK